MKETESVSRRKFIGTSAIAGAAASFPYVAKGEALQSDTIIAICMQRDPKESIPEWEEIASIGAAVQNMYLTCSAYNIGCYWSSPEAIKHLNGYLNLKIGERCLGFLYMGYHEMPSIKGMRRSIAEKIEWF